MEPIVSKIIGAVIATKEVAVLVLITSITGERTSNTGGTTMMADIVIEIVIDSRALLKQIRNTGIVAQAVGPRVASPMLRRHAASSMCGVVSAICEV
eukprot:XP_001705139.1 Hypothetical protein GL50803_10088 [Giardia lamblia ATCC 50803]